MLRNKKQGKSNQRSKGKTRKGFKRIRTTFVPPEHPAIIISSDFSSPHIEKLKNRLSQENLSIVMQSNKSKINKHSGIPTDKYFFIVDNNKGPVQLSGDFNKLKKQEFRRVNYPRGCDIDKVLKKYRQFIGKGKQIETIEDGQEIEGSEYEREDEFDEDFSDNKLMSKNGPAGKSIKLKSISRNLQSKNQGNNNSKNLYVYQDDQESRHYKDYIGNLKKKDHKNVTFVRSLNEYLRLSQKNGKDDSVLLIGQKANETEGDRLNKLNNDVLVYGSNVKNCSKINTQNVRGIAFQPEDMNVMLKDQGFSPRLKAKRFQTKKPRNSPPIKLNTQNNSQFQYQQSEQPARSLKASKAPSVNSQTEKDNEKVNEKVPEKVNEKVNQKVNKKVNKKIVKNTLDPTEVQEISKQKKPRRQSIEKKPQLKKVPLNIPVMNELRYNEKENYVKKNELKNDDKQNYVKKDELKKEIGDYVKLLLEKNKQNVETKSTQYQKCWEEYGHPKIQQRPSAPINESNLDYSNYDKFVENGVTIYRPKKAGIDPCLTERKPLTSSNRNYQPLIESRVRVNHSQNLPQNDSNSGNHYYSKSKICPLQDKIKQSKIHSNNPSSQYHDSFIYSYPREFHSNGFPSSQSRFKPFRQQNFSENYPQTPQQKIIRREYYTNHEGKRVHKRFNSQQPGQDYLEVRYKSQYEPKFNARKLSGMSELKKRQPSLRKVNNFNKSLIYKDQSLLYLIDDSVPRNLQEKIEKLPDQKDTVYVYEKQADLQNQMKKGTSIYDLVFVFMNKIEQAPTDLAKNNSYFVQQNKQVEDEIKIDNNFIYIDDLQKLSNHINPLIKRNKTKIIKNKEISHIYYKDFNKNIHEFVQTLKLNFPSECRKFFGIQDLPTILPSFSESDYVILLIDEVGYKEMQYYCDEQRKYGVKLITFCLPKSREFRRLCKKQSQKNPIIWLAEHQIRDTGFVLARIKEYMESM